MSRIAKRYLLIGGVLALVGVGLIIGAIRPYKNALGAPPPSPTVEVVQVQQEDVPIYAEWIGTLDGFTNADVRAQVTGYLLKQGYQEGAFVRQGQLLFQVDPRPFQAAFDQAQGQLAQAKAALANAQAVQRRTELDVERYTPLAKEQAASQQDLDNAVQNNLAALATIETARAQIKTYVHQPADNSECLVSITEREAQPPTSLGGPNYLPIQRGQVEDAWINEFVAPLHGLENARSAQGNRAAAQLAVTVCSAFSHSPKGKLGESAEDAAPLEVQAATIASAGKSYVARTVHAASADENRPYFADVAMCRGDDEGDLAVNPPLGWVLSETTRDGLDAMLCRCGNTDQITHLKAALSLPGGWTCKKQQEPAGLSTWADAPQRYSASP